MTAVLRFAEVACLRGGRLLFERLSFALPPGEALWVQGPNGAGKSSLLRLAGGLLRPTSGTVEAEPAALADEGLALDRELPLGAALRFWARLDGGGDALGQVLTDLDLRSLAPVPVRMLSAGQARRARLARVLLSGAPLWLLDEPLNGLDSAASAGLGPLLRRHLDGGGAILAASHQPLPGAEWQVLEIGR